MNLFDFFLYKWESYVREKPETRDQIYDENDCYVRRGESDRIIDRMTFRWEHLLVEGSREREARGI